MLYLIAALAALAVGPLLDAGAGHRRGFVPVLDGLSRTAIPGLVFLAFVPAAVGEGEWTILLALAGGFLIPVLAERTSRRATRPTHRLALLAGLSGFVIHAALDGAALATLPSGTPPSFPLAVVLHRLPVGVAIWWLVAREIDRRAGVAALAALVLATVGDSCSGARWPGWSPIPGR